ncbi:Ndufa5, NADH-ubiquinone oxidoreductase subunit [Pseudovirgaria hyperparasitica]|uniref:Ndufa5, NADH-ubiquinone oxidoreductase subunit n=1 Tax=Pseudovirgaria hyperparasitica TaxID=470096 RepID=A0A6A6WLC5_9PEZI|nr:Ndufa5, NADH-ubiquinone oxidoreductase subunit [Pseudovirgaria hyperparasitica]KAF2762973.1 Ndufa5, NADH-ubiquinone oxidoreductase subunit [Pseudovirgaria hyperparasitica]
MRPATRLLATLKGAKPTYHTPNAPTGLAGLLTHPHPRPALIYTYKQTLQALGQMPESSVYRQSVEAITKARLRTKQAADGEISDIETQIGAGLIEEVIQVAEGELELVKNMITAKPWEELVEKAPEGQWSYFERGTGTEKPPA